MVEALKLVLACWDYDRTRPLMDGRVRPEGVGLTVITLPPEECFWRMLRFREFDASELSFAQYIRFRASGDRSLIAIPVFLSRMFRHSGFYVRADSGIEHPKDLIGRRMGVPEYQMTAAVWMRALLQHEYGVSPEELTWYVARREELKLPLDLPPQIRLHPLLPGQSLTGMLEAGEIDALMTARAPESFRRGSSRIRRLFPDFRQAEAAYYTRTGLFPIMHLVVLKAALHQAQPWIARSLYKAFCQAKALCYRDLAEQAVAKVTLPWVVAEFEAAQQILGEDLWPYGLARNRACIEALISYLEEQHLIPQKVAVEELFADNTLEEFETYMGGDHAYRGEA